MANLQISVVVLTWNGLAYLPACLESLLAQDYPAFEVIVVDNGSTDGTPQWLAEHFPGVRLICNERNLGFAGGNNAGLRVAKGDLLVLLNNDTEVHAGWLSALAAAFAEPTVGIAGCKLLYPDGTIQHAGAFLHGARGESKHVGRFAPDDGRFDEPADVDFVTGAALAISRAALEQIGPLDEGFSPIYYEDSDWCYRARAAGYRVVYQPAAVVTHHESKATDALSHERRFAINQGRLRLVFKHWPLDRLAGEFLAEEMAWLARQDRSEDLMAARRAYLHSLLALPGILAFRHASPAEAESLVALLTELRGASVAGLTDLLPSGEAPAGQPREGDAILQALRQGQTLREHTFSSDAPLLGRLIATVRSLWNSVATKWYVRPLIQQQSAFNEQSVAYFEALRRQMEKQEHQFTRDVAENIRELTALAQRLAELESSLADRPRGGATD